jgi:hypothetical protein
LVSTRRRRLPQPMRLRPPLSKAAFSIPPWILSKTSWTRSRRPSIDR